MLDEELDVAVVTDAGTPCISDPGSVLAREAAALGIEVLAVPGPTAMASALSVQYANRDRNRENAKLKKEIDKLVQKTNILTTRNTGKGNRANATVGESKSKGNVDTGVSNTFKIAHNTKNIAAMEASGVKNDADSIAATELSKINFQSTIVSMLLQRRFDHALIGAHAYRHIFRDGDTTLKLNSDSQAAQLFEGGAGLPPTVNSMATMAANLRRERLRREQLQPLLEVISVSENLFGYLLPEKEIVFSGK